MVLFQVPSVMSTSIITNEVLSRVYGVTKRLHKATKFRTFYELFGLSEKSGFKDIQKNYRKMLVEGKFPDNTPITDSIKKSLSDAYDIFKRYKDAYDHILDNPLLLRQPPPSRVGVWKGMLLGVALLLLLDFVVVAIRILMSRQTTKKPKKNGNSSVGSASSGKKSKRPEKTLGFGDLQVVRLYRFLSKMK